MSVWSPTTEGFRTMFRKPSLSIGEIAWRWSFGAAACVLLGLTFLAYLDTLPVDRTDMLLLRTRHPVLVAQAFSHILQGSALRIVLAGIVLCSALALLWVLLASLGRGATLVPLLDDVRYRAKTFSAAIHSSENAPFAAKAPLETWRMRSLAGLNFLRAALALAAMGSGLAAVLFAGFASSKEHPHPGATFFLASTMLLLLWMIWFIISWFPSVAAIFVVSHGETTFDALLSTVDLFRSHFGSVMAVGTWFGLAHLVAFFAISSVVAVPFAFIPAVPLSLVLLAVLLLTLAYFAIVDTLHIGRLAGYVAILEAPPRPAVSLIPPPELAPAGVQSSSAMVDQDELILSDVHTIENRAESPGEPKPSQEIGSSNAEKEEPGSQPTNPQSN